MLAAEYRGDIDNVLDRARRHLEEDHATTDLEIENGAMTSTGRTIQGVFPKMRYIFISHASADKPLADLFRETLVLGGVPAEVPFYSAARDTGIPTGEDVRNHLREKLRESALVVELISETFSQRPVCLIELGAAWVLGIPTYPIVVPPLARDDVFKQVGEVYVGLLGDDREIGSVFDELNDRISCDVSLSLKTATWNSASRRFKSQFPGVLSDVATAATEAARERLPEPKRVSESLGNKQKISLSNETAVNTPYGTEVHGEATNNNAVEHPPPSKQHFMTPAVALLEQ